MDMKPSLKIVDRLDSLNWSKKRLSAEAGVDLSTISRVTNTKAKKQYYPNAAKGARIAKALGVRADSLWSDADELELDTPPAVDPRLAGLEKEIPGSDVLTRKDIRRAIYEYMLRREDGQKDRDAGARTDIAGTDPLAERTEALRKPRRAAEEQTRASG